MAAPRAIAATLVCVVLAACGGSEHAAQPWTRVHFRASDGVLLDGRLFGDGTVGVVLSHMGRPGDAQADWRTMAEQLADKGLLVLTYNRRGVCPGGRLGCSRGTDYYEDHWKDVVGASRFLRRRGANRIVLVGASIGAMASLYAAAHGWVSPAGLVELAGINHASGYDFTRGQLRRIPGKKLFISAREDTYGGGDSAREWFRWAREPKELALVAGSDHGTDLLRPGNPEREHVEAVIEDFVGTVG